MEKEETMSKEAGKTDITPHAQGSTQNAFTFRTCAKLNKVLSDRHLIAKFELLFVLVGMLIILPACGGSVGNSSTPTPTSHSNTNTPNPSPTTNTSNSSPVADPTQDPNSPVLMLGSGQLVDTCLNDQSCEIIFGLAKPGTQDFVSDWPKTVKWNVTSSVPGITFDNPEGQFTQGNDTATIHITAISGSCLPALITMTTADVKIEKNVIPFLCDPGLVLKLADNTSFPIYGLSQNTPGCSPQAGSLACSISLSRTSGFQGEVKWEAASNQSVQIQPSSDKIAPSQPVQVVVSNIPCNSGDGIVNFKWSEDYGSAVDSVYFSWTSTTCQ